MHCNKCGSELPPGSNFCQNCGARTQAPETPRKEKPWFTTIFLALVGLIVIGVYFLLNQEDLDQVVKNEITAIKDKRYTEAYYEHTSKDFQATTSLEAFKQFVRSHSIFYDNTTVTFQKSEIKDNVGVVQTQLTAKDGTNDSVLFHLVKEDDKWKINYMQIEGAHAQATQNPTPVSDKFKGILAPIEKQLNALQKNDLKGAYEGNVSSDFLKQTPFESFSSFVKEYPILTTFVQYAPTSPAINDKQADITVILNPGQEDIPLKYKLINENDEWKIWGLQIVLPADENAKNPLMHPKQLTPVVEAMLKDLQNKKVDDAYNNLTSAEFRSITDLATFKAFLNVHPLISSHETASMKDALIENTQYGRVNVVLKQGENAAEFLFSLELEKNSWKILGIQEVSPASAKTPITPADQENQKKAIVELIQKQLQAIREHNLKKAYTEYTSPEYFQKVVPFDKFQEFVSKFPVLTSDYKATFAKFTFHPTDVWIEGVLTVDGKIDYSIKYEVENGTGDWKINYMEIIPPSPPPVEATEKVSVNTPPIGISLQNKEKKTALNGARIGIIHTNVFVENDLLGNNIAIITKQDE